MFWRVFTCLHATYALKFAYIMYTIWPLDPMSICLQNYTLALLGQVLVKEEDRMLTKIFYIIFVKVTSNPTAQTPAGGIATKNCL